MSLLGETFSSPIAEIYFFHILHGLSGVELLPFLLGEQFSLDVVLPLGEVLPLDEGLPLDLTRSVVLFDELLPSGEALAGILEKNT